MPRVSVIIPTHNRAHLLNRAVQSVLDQTYQDFEIIITDDASTDNTEELVKGFNDGRIQYYRHEKNQGGSAARNTSMKHASGEYFAFLDSDDEWFPDKLEKQLTAFEKGENKLGVVYTDFDYKSELAKTKYSGNISQSILVVNFVGTTSTPLVKKECFDKTGFFDAALPCGQDWDMWIRLAQHYEFYFIDEVLVRYYLQPASITMSKKGGQEGLLRIEEKYKGEIGNLPKRLQAEHYFVLAKVFYWRRNSLCLKYFAKSITTDISIAPEVIDYLFINKIRKLFRGKASTE